jgi:hypothetical protein
MELEHHDGMTSQQQQAVVSWSYQGVFENIEPMKILETYAFGEFFYHLLMCLTSEIIDNFTYYDCIPNEIIENFTYYDCIPNGVAWRGLAWRGVAAQAQRATGASVFMIP